MSEHLSRRRLLTVAALGLSSLTGCGYRPGGGDVRWETDSDGFSEPDAVYAPPGGTLTVSRSVQRYDFERETWLRGGVVTAYDPTTGDTRGDTVTSDGVRCDCAGDEGVYVGTDGNAVVAVGLDGNRRFRVDLNAAPVAVASGADLVAVLTRTGRLRAFDPDGADRWTVSIVEDDASPPVPRSSVLTVSSAGVVAQIGRTQPRLVVFDLDGTRRWTRRDASATPVSRIEPAVVDNRFVFVSPSTLTARSIHDGGEQWTRAVASPRGLAVEGDTCYLLEPSGLSAFSLDGRSRWTFGSPAGGDVGRSFSAGPVATAEGVFVATGRRLFGIAPDGTERWRSPVDARPRDLALTDRVLVRTTNRGLVAHWRRDQF